MRINRPYTSIEELPSAIPVFPLPGALLLPRGHLPLNIFEKRYLAMIDDSLATHRLVGMIQPAADSNDPAPALMPVGTIGRITQIAETGDGRYVLTLTGVCRFRITAELDTVSPYRKCNVDYGAFACDLLARNDDSDVDRSAVIESLRRYSQANHMKVDWKEIDKTPGEALVNALCMMGPFNLAEKQALLEARDLPARAEMLVAITEIAIQKSCGEGQKLQ